MPPLFLDMLDVRARRRLIQALLASLALHALILFSALPERARQQLAQPLVATLRAPVAAVTPPAAPYEDTLPAPEVTKPRLLTRPPQVDERPALLAPARDEQRAEEAPANAIHPSQTASTQAEAVSASPPALSAPGLDAGGVRQYRIELASAARGFKVYPRMALERGLTGTAEIEVMIAADGRVRSVQLIASSGHAVLDNQAREMLRQAVQRTSVPDSLRGREFAIKLPVVFDLNQE